MASENIIMAMVKAGGNRQVRIIWRNCLKYIFSLKYLNFVCLSPNVHGAYKLLADHFVYNVPSVIIHFHSLTIHIISYSEWTCSV